MSINKKYLGISTVEIIIVLAISTMMFAVAVGFFGTRTRTARDDAARLVVSEIAKVRNEAQQGLGPSTTSGRAILAGNELFGQAIEYRDREMVVYKLMKKPDKIITAYESYTIPLTQQLRWWIVPNSSGPCDVFNSCYSVPGGGYSGLVSYPVSFNNTNQTIMTVFKNNSGESYVFSRVSPAGILGGNQFLGVDANKVANYTPNRQGTLRLAYAVPDGGAEPPGETEFDNADVQYYVIFDLSIPNDQQFEVVR